MHAPSNSETEEHLRAHYKGRAMLLHWLPANGDGPMPGKHFVGGDYEAAAEWARIQNRQLRHVYITQAECKQEYVAEKKPEKADLDFAFNLHVDIDNVGDREETKRRLLAHPLPPSRILFSSDSGVQGFWDLDAPVPPEKFEELEAANRGLCGEFGEKNVGTVNADRVMRVAGTCNVKPKYKDERGKYPKATLVHNEAVEYSLSQFEQVEKKASAPTATTTTFVPPDAPVQPAGDLYEFLKSHDVADDVCLLITNALDAMPPGCDWVSTYNGDRSTAVFRVLCELLRCEVPGEKILSIVTNRDNPISAHFYKDDANGLRAIGLAKRQMEKAHAAVEANDSVATANKGS